MNFIFRILVNAAALAVTAYLLPDFSWTQGVVGLLIVAAVFGLVNSFIRPIVQFFSFPITFLTLGLFALVINAGMLLLTSYIVGDLLRITGDTFFDVLLTAFIGAIIISIVSSLLNLVLPDKD